MAGFKRPKWRDRIVNIEIGKMVQPNERSKLSNMFNDSAT